MMTRELPWFWNSKAARYQWRNGRALFLSRDTVMRYVQQDIAASESAGRALARLVANGQLSPADWRAAMRAELRDEYIRQYLVGRGGRAQMTASDWGRVGGMLRDQYRYLDNFTEEIAAGRLSEAQIAARSGMYFNSSREAFERAQNIAHKAAGFGYVRWVVMPMAEHCEDCLAFQAQGWQPVDPPPFGAAYPGSGHTACLTNCKCTLEYSKHGDGN
jgi:hypothetical protein